MRPLRTAFVSSLALSAVVLSAACSDSSPSPTGIDPAADPGAGTSLVESALPTSCSAYPRTRLVNVSTASQLSTALSYAQPGDLIQLAAGVYRGRFTVTRSGTATRPIVLCGTRAAVLDGGSIWSGGAVLKLNASYWTVDGVTMRNAQQGVVARRATRTVLRRVEIHTIGQAAVQFHVFSRHNVLERSYIHHTGRATAQYGEGVYVGTWHSQWGSTTGGLADRSDSNRVRGNVIGPYLGSEAVDIKDGVTGTVVDSNTFDGLGGSLSTSNLNSVVIVIGNNNTVAYNRLKNALRWGFEVEQLLTGWGYRNVFRGNVLDMSGARGPGIFVGTTAVRSSTVVKCDNSVIGTALSNLTCIR
jgi:hypothetical protein